MHHVTLFFPLSVVIDPAEQIWQLTKTLQRVQGENAGLKSDNDSLTEEVKTLQDRVAQLEKQLSDKSKQVRTVELECMCM